MESKKINQLATELTPALSDLTIIGDPTTGISKKITLSQMASLFTGTVEEYANLAAFPLVGVADTIYIALDTNVLYRWDTGLTSYVELSPNIINSLVFSDANGFDGTISLVGSVATLTITTALTTGSVPFIGASGALSQDNANFFFDDTNNRLGINTNAPTTALDVFGSGIIGRLNGTSTNNSFLGFASAGTNKWSIGNVQSDHRFRIYNEATTSELVSVLQTGEFGIGIANPLTKIHIFGGASALIANLDANTSVAKSISFRSGNSSRINLEVSGTESGSNAGADFFIRRYSDAGALIDTPLTITRSTGNISTTGALGIGTASLTGINLRLAKTITGATTSYGILQQGIVQSDVTTTAFGYYNEIGTQAAAFTLTNYRHFFATASTIGAGSTVTNQVGFFASATLTGGTNNYGFQGSIPSGTNRWNLFMDGTAANYMAGQLLIGTTTTSAFALDIVGSLRSVVTTGRSITSTSNSTSLGTVLLTNNGAASYVNTLDMLAPNLTATQSVSFTLGTAASTNNTVGFNFYNAGAGSTSNAATFTFFGGSPLLWLRANGNMQLGTSTDSGYKLDVNGTGRFRSDVELNGGTGTRTLTIQSNTSGDAVLSLLAAGSNGGSIFYKRSTSELTFNNNAIDAFKIAASGDSTFQYSNTSAESILNLTNLSTGNNVTKGSRFVFRLTDTVGTVKDSGYISVYPNTSKPNVEEAYMAFATRSSDAAPAERMRLTTLGNLHIGSSTETGRRLYVLGSGNTSASFCATFDNSSSFTLLGLRNDGNIVTNSTVFNNTTGGTTRTVYIGNSDYYIGGISSIRKSKKNIQEFTSEWIYDLKPVQFNYRKKDEEGNYTEEIYEEINYGLIAEDTAPIADFLINYDDTKDGEKIMVGIEYMRLITPMLKEIQELKKEIDILKAK